MIQIARGNIFRNINLHVCAIEKISPSVKRKRKIDRKLLLLFVTWMMGPAWGVGR